MMMMMMMMIIIIIIIIPCIAGRKRRKECGLVNGEAGIGVPHDQSSNIYISVTRVIHNLSRENMC